MDTTSKVITGFLLGAIAGTIAGLLLAPEPGENTRKKITERSNKLVKQVAGYIGVRSFQGEHSKNGKASVGSPK